MEIYAVGISTFALHYTNVFCIRKENMGISAFPSDRALPDRLEICPGYGPRVLTDALGASDPGGPLPGGDLVSHRHSIRFLLPLALSLLLLLPAGCFFGEEKESPGDPDGTGRHRRWSIITPESGTRI